MTRSNDTLNMNESNGSIDVHDQDTMDDALEILSKHVADGRKLSESQDLGFYSDGDGDEVTTEGSSSSDEEAMYSPSCSPRSTVDQPWRVAKKNPSLNLAKSHVADSRYRDILNSGASKVIEFNPQVIANPVINGSSVHRRPSEKKALIDDDSDEDDDSYDSEGWKKKPIELWNENDTKSWLSDASIKIGQLYHQISPKLVMTGVNLLLLTVEDWLGYDDKFGKQLHDLLQCELKYRTPIIDSNLQTEEPDIDSFKNGTTLQGSDSSSSDEDSESELSGEPGEPNEHSPSLCQLFVMHLLDNPKYNSSIICWRNYKKRIFQFKESEIVANLWSKFGNNKFKKYTKPMTFDTFTRAVRHHYRTGVKSGTGPVVFLPHPDRTIYKLGPGAIGYRNADRRFEHYQRFASLIKKHKLPFLQGCCSYK